MAAGSSLAAPAAPARCYLRDVDAAAVARGRTVRALLFGAVTTSAAVLAHWSGSGMTAPLGVVAAGFAVATLVGWRLVPRRRARSVVLASVGLQVALHAAFAAGMAAGGMRVMSLLLCQAGHVQGVRVDAPPGFLAPQHGLLAMTVGLPGLPMLLAHVVAGAVSGGWLYAVDHLGRALAAVAHAVLRSALPAVPAAGTIAYRPPAPRPGRRRRAIADTCDEVRAGCGRRGPPALASC